MSCVSLLPLIWQTFQSPVGHQKERWRTRCAIKNHGTSSSPFVRGDVEVIFSLLWTTFTPEDLSIFLLLRIPSFLPYVTWCLEEMALLSPQRDAELLKHRTKEGRETQMHRFDFSFLCLCERQTEKLKCTLPLKGLSLTLIIVFEHLVVSYLERCMMSAFAFIDVFFHKTVTVSLSLGSVLSCFLSAYSFHLEKGIFPLINRWCRDEGQHHRHRHDHQNSNRVMLSFCLTICGVWWNPVISCYVMIIGWFAGVIVISFFLSSS